MQITGIIPARYGSSRFPGKALINIEGKSMIQRVYEQASKCKSLSAVVVATDSEEIEKHVKGFNGRALMTGENNRNGTERCNEAAQKLKLKEEDVVINIQADEPFIKPEHISQLAAYFSESKKGQASIATLVKQIHDREALFNPVITKTILNTAGEAIYFSSATVPYVRHVAEADWISKAAFYKHIGIYAYTVMALKEIAALPPSPLEKAESLEQLRWIEHGYKIKALITTYESQSVDTPEDLKNISKNK